MSDGLSESVSLVILTFTPLSGKPFTLKPTFRLGRITGTVILSQLVTTERMSIRVVFGI